MPPPAPINRSHMGMLGSKGGVGAIALEAATSLRLADGVTLSPLMRATAQPPNANINGQIGVSGAGAGASVPLLTTGQVRSLRSAVDFEAARDSHRYSFSNGSVGGLSISEAGERDSDLGSGIVACIVLDCIVLSIVINIVR